MWARPRGRARQKEIKGSRYLSIETIAIQKFRDPNQKQQQVTLRNVQDIKEAAIQWQPGMNAKSAISQVLDIRALLISAQLVSRTWLDLIRKPPSIQRAYFVHSDPGILMGMEEKTSNPLLAGV